MPISHAKTITIADGTNTDIVRPVDWMAAHVGELTLNYFNPWDEAVKVVGQQGQGVLHMQPVVMPNVSFDRIHMLLAGSKTVAGTMSATLTMRMGFYTKNGVSLSLSTSTSSTWAMTLATSNTSLISGIRMASIPMSHSVPAGAYWIGIVSSSSGTVAADATISQVLCSQIASTLAVWMAASSSSNQGPLGFGHYSAATNGLPSVMAFSEIYGGSSLDLRPPVFWLANSTA